MTQSAAVDSAMEKAQAYEQKAYADTTPSGSAEELDASDFKQAAAKAADAVSGAAQNLKAAVLGEDAESAGSMATAQGKAVASSPAEPLQGVFTQVMAAGELVADKLLPVAHAAGRDEDKWGRAKEEAREGTREFSAAVRDAADAATDKARNAADRTADKTAGFFQGAKDTARGAAQETEDLSRSAADRVRRDWPGREVRGVVDETKDLTNSAAERVKGDWQDVKRGTRRTLDESSAVRDWEAKHAPKKEERGWFSSLFGGNGDADAGDKARQAADNARNEAEKGKEKAKGWFNDTSDEARRTADDAKDRTRRWFDSASDDTRRTADKAEDKTRGFFNRAADEADRLGDKTSHKLNRFGERVSETAEDAKHTVQDKLNRAEDYLTADLRPVDEVDKLLSQGFVPSNTWEVLHSRRYSREE